MGNASSKKSIRMSLILSLGIGMILISVVMTFIIGRTVLRSNKEQITKSIVTLSEAKSISVERRMTEVVNAAEALAGLLGGTYYRFCLGLLVTKYVRP